MKQKKSVYKNLLILDLNSTYFGVSCAHAYTNSQKNVNYISKSIQTHTLSLVRSRTVHTFFFVTLLFFVFSSIKCKITSCQAPAMLSLYNDGVNISVCIRWKGHRELVSNKQKKKNNRYSMTGS